MLQQQGPCIWKLTVVTIKYITFTTLYLLISLTAFFAFYLISRRISGPRLSDGGFWLFLAISLFWGANQMSISRYGYFLFYLPPTDFFEKNYIIRWIAFISALLQALCIPIQGDTTRRWLSRK